MLISIDKSWNLGLLSWEVLKFGFKKVGVDLKPLLLVKLIGLSSSTEASLDSSFTVVVEVVVAWLSALIEFNFAVARAMKIGKLYYLSFREKLRLKII